MKYLRFWLWAYFLLMLSVLTLVVAVGKEYEQQRK